MLGARAYFLFQGHSMSVILGLQHDNLLLPGAFFKFKLVSNKDVSTLQKESIVFNTLVTNASGPWGVSEDL